MYGLNILNPLLELIECLEPISRRLKPLVDTGLENGANRQTKPFELIELIEPFEPWKPLKPPKPLISYICVTLLDFNGTNYDEQNHYYN